MSQIAVNLSLNLKAVNCVSLVWFKTQFMQFFSISKSCPECWLFTYIINIWIRNCAKMVQNIHQNGSNVDWNSQGLVNQVILVKPAALILTTFRYFSILFLVNCNLVQIIFDLAFMLSNWSSLKGHNYGVSPVFFWLPFSLDGHI